MRVLIVLLSSIVAVAGCSSAPVPDKELRVTATTSAGCINKPEWSYSANRGATVFKANCAYCHKADGSGQTGQVPALANNQGLSADPDRGIRLLMLTKTGKARTHGMEYADMVAILDELSNRDLADVLTYVLSSWGNCAGPIKSDRIKAVAASM